MSKIRVHELAKELGKSSKDVIYALKGHGIDVESHMSTISSETADKIRAYFNAEKTGAKAGNRTESKDEHKTEKKTETKVEEPKDHPQGTQANAGNSTSATERNHSSSAEQNRSKATAERNSAKAAAGQNSSKAETEQSGIESADEQKEDSRNVEHTNAQHEAHYNDSRAGQGSVHNDSHSSQNRGYDRNREGRSENRENRSHDSRQRNDGQRSSGNRSYERNGSSRGNYDRSGHYSERNSSHGNGENRSSDHSGNGNRHYSSYSSENQRYSERGSYSRNNSTRNEGRGHYANDSRSEGTRSEGRGNGRYSSDSRAEGRSGERGSYDRNREGRSGENRSNRYNNNYRGEGSRYSDRREGERSSRYSGENRGYDRNREGRGGENRGQNRSYNRSGENRGSRGRNDREGRFNLDSAINKEVVVQKDTTRESRRNYKDNKDRDRDYRDRDEEQRPRRGKNNSISKKKQLTPPTPKPKPVVEKVTNIVLPEVITLKELGEKMKVPGAEIVKKLFLAGKALTLNSEITYDEAEEIALDYDILCEHEVVVDVLEELLKDEEEDEKDLLPRPPVVCVMGHVDHGKTSILDAIRKTNVTASEAGGITQRIGASVVDVNGQKITFLDTPGHEAFTAMRLRGAQATDIAILVVAADDGVMPQTIEAINHAKAAGIEIIVAINKIDKPSANVERVKQELTEYELVAEDWGGKTIMVPVSAHTGEGLSELLDMILLEAEMLELKANPNRKARGVVLEARLDKGRGPVATVLVQKGTLKVGDIVSVGTAYGKVRALIDDKGNRIKSAGPSMPAEVLGLNEVPQAGDVFISTKTEKEARTISEAFVANNREKLLAETKGKLSLEGLFNQIKAGEVKELNIVVKADVQGSVEAVKQSLVKLSNDEVAVKVIHGAVGAINESDVTLAAASNAIIIGFNVRPDSMAKTLAEQENVDMRLYRVIYNAIDDVEAAMKGMLEPTYQEKVIGHAEVRQTYKVSGVGTVIGAYVTDGQVLRNCKARLLRDNVVLYEGELASLRRFKDDVKEVNAGYECGMSLDKYNDVKVGDQIEMFIMEEIPR